MGLSDWIMPIGESMIRSKKRTRHERKFVSTFGVGSGCPCPARKDGGEGAQEGEGLPALWGRR